VYAIGRFDHIDINVLL